MTAFPKNPFRPGAGLNPAHKGSRPEIESVLLRLLRNLRDDDCGGEMAFLYGPRGNGKTVLLHWLRAEAAKEGAPDEERIVVVRISSTQMKSPEAVAQTILNATSGSLRRLKLEAGVSVAGIGSLWVAGSGKSPPLSLAEVLAQKTAPMLVTLDEAHEASPEMLGDLLNVVQEAGEARPIAAVFAGTPGLEAALRAAHASFWSRGRKLRIGLLAEMSAREALAQPFRTAGLEADDGAVAELAAAADNYPYFLQLYGEAAWNVVEASGGRALLPEHVAPAIAAAEDERQNCYSDRLDEFEEADLLPLARRVAEAFVASAKASADRRLPNAALDRLVARGNGKDGKAFLVAKGYVWRDGTAGRSWTPGIPSLMDYALEEIPAA